MKSILQELFNGSIYPDELIISRDPDYSLLSNLRSEVDSLHAEASFMYGFKLATWIMIEAITGKGELVRNEN